MRLDKLIAHSTGLSRKEVKRALHRGEVCLNDQVVRDGGIPVRPEDLVTLNGTALHLPGPRYFMLHKPQGVVCANQDSDHPTVLDLLGEEKREGLQIAGRLDLDTTGLVLITDDGQWNHRATSPNNGKRKTYRVTTAAAITPAQIEALSAGIQLQGESKPCRPADLRLLDERQGLLSICEGKYHQVKRMFAAVGNRVEALHRLSIGDITLDADLAEGQYRPLTQSEINCI